MKNPRPENQGRGSMHERENIAIDNGRVLLLFKGLHQFFSRKEYAAFYGTD